MSMSHPERIGKYDILGELGRGGMGVVYRAQDKRMGRMVAIKTVTEDFTDDDNMLERFYHEAEKTGRLKHPNIVTVYDLGEQDGSPYIVMEFVDGTPLDKIIKDKKPQPLLEKLLIIEQVCSALGYAHQHDVIHRDVKPANVIVQHDGLTKLLDFGIAREEKRTGQGLTRTGAVIGTVPYMAPERLKGAPVDGRSDIFAAGILLYQTLTGHLPFQGEDGVLVTKLLSEKHPPLSLYLQEYPPALDHILDRSLAKSPDDRYSTADEMSAELFGVIDELKREHIGDMIVQVKRLSLEQQFVAARDALMQLLKLDNQHTEARKMLAEVQQHLSRKQREEQAQKLFLQAEDLLRGRDFEQAIELLTQAEQLVPDDVAISELLDTTRSKRQVQEQIERFLRKAETARSAGDFSGAKAIVEEAMELDALDSRVQSAYTALARQVEEAQRRAKSRSLVDQARNELKLRKYSEALVTLKEIEQIDPFHPELQTMLSAVTTGAQQEQRRKLLDETENVVARAVTYDQAKAALVTLQGTIEKAGSDPALLRLQAQVMRQVREFESKKLVEDTVRECRAKLDSAPAEALRLVQAALAQLPGNEHLLGLQHSIEERLAKQSLDERRTELLTQAHKALSENKFADAVKVLEACQGELRSHEIGELLEFARNEMYAEEQRQFVASALTEGQRLMREGQFDEAISMLEFKLRQGDDSGLRSLLEQARTQRQVALAKASAAASAAEPLLQAEGYEQAVSYLESLPKEVQASTEVQAALKRARAGLEREREFLSFAGKFYALLSEQAPTKDWDGLQEPAGAQGVMAEMMRALGIRRSAVANRRVTREMAIVREKLQTGEISIVDEVVQRQTPLLQHCAKDTQAQWSSLMEQYAALKNGGGKGKLGRKGR